MSADPHKSPLLTDDLSVMLGFADGSVATVVYTATGDTAYPKERVEVFCEGKVMVSDDFRRLSITRGGRTHTSRPPQADKGHAAEMRAFLDLAAGMPSPSSPSPTACPRPRRRSRWWSPSPSASPSLCQMVTAE